VARIIDFYTVSTYNRKYRDAKRQYMIMREEDEDGKRKNNRPDPDL
jgi:hypothetical protein